MLHRFTIIFIALYAGFITANAQNHPLNATSGSAACRDGKSLLSEDLYGNWVLELLQTNAAGNVITTRLSFKQNPEFKESLAGQFSLQGQEMEVFGDIEDGVLDLEESDNGKDIRALWKGRIADGSCGSSLIGTRRILATQTEQNFVLCRMGW